MFLVIVLNLLQPFCSTLSYFFYNHFNKWIDNFTYFPLSIGPEVMKIFDLELTKNSYYEGYDPRVNPTIANSFSAAAYRFGHSLVQHNFARYDKHHHLISDSM